MPRKPSTHKPITQLTPRHLEQRENSTQRGYTYKWQKARKLFIADNPLCIDCLAEGKLIRTDEVDHIIPHKGDASLFWDRTNWRALCKSHHSAKTAREDGGFGNRNRRRRGHVNL